MSGTRVAAKQDIVTGGWCGSRRAVRPTLHYGFEAGGDGGLIGKEKQTAINSSFLWVILFPRRQCRAIRYSPSQHESAEVICGRPKVGPLVPRVDLAYVS